MIAGPRYELLLGVKFVQDLRRVAAAARRDPAAAYLRKQLLAHLDELAEGSSDGHHGLGWEPGKGDLRDCVTGYVRSDPRGSADYRVVFREIGAGWVGELPGRELLVVRGRWDGVYEHACARLGRHLVDRQPGLNRFGDRAPGGRMNQVQRQAELDARRAVAHAWTGQKPLASSRPLSQSPGLANVTRSSDGAVGRTGGAPARGGAAVPAPAPGERPGRPGPTGWPGR